MHRNAMLCLKGTATRKRPSRKSERGPEAPPRRPGQEMAPAPNADDGIRHGLVARVRAEIAAGTYDTEEKLQAALDRLADRLGQ